LPLPPFVCTPSHVGMVRVGEMNTTLVIIITIIIIIIIIIISKL
jgi:hypothetical protein